MWEFHCGNPIHVYGVLWTSSLPVFIFPVPPTSTLFTSVWSASFCCHQPYTCSTFWSSSLLRILSFLPPLLTWPQTISYIHLYPMISIITTNVIIILSLVSTNEWEHATCNIWFFELGISQYDDLQFHPFSIKW
jgi:hypothetical protein